MLWLSPQNKLLVHISRRDSFLTGKGFFFFLVGGGYHLQPKVSAAPLIRACTSLSGTRSDMHFASEVWRTWYGADGE